MKNPISNLKQHVGVLKRRNLLLVESNQRQAVEIVANKRAEKALRESEEHLRELFYGACQMEENLRSLSNRVLHLQEEERKHISRELHDEVGQALTAISLTLAALKNNGAGESPKSRQKISEAQQLLQGTMETVHNFTRELRPRMLDELGLLPALRAYMKSFAKRTGLRVQLRAGAATKKLNDSQKTVLFRIAQESLTNVAKHAAATQVSVVIRKAGDSVCMEVIDDGKSFREDAANSAKRKQRLGLLGMQERARLVNGKFTIKPKPGKGTTIRVVIPMPASD